MFNTFKKIILLCDKNKIFLYFLILLNSLSVLVEMVSIGLLIPIGTILFFPDLIIKNELFNLFFKFFATENTDDHFYILITILISAYIFKFLYFLFLSLIENYITNNIQYNLSITLFDNFLKSSYKDFKKYKLSEINNTIFNESEVFHASLSNLIILISEIFLIFTVVAFLLFMNPFLVLSILSIFLIGSLLFTFFILNKIKILGSIRLINAKSSIDNILNTFAAFIDIKIINSSSFFIKKYSNTFHKFINSNRWHGTFLRLPRIWIEFLLVCTFVFIFFYIKFYISDVESFFTIFSFMVVFSIRLLPSFNRILSSYQTIKYNSVSIDSLFSKINYEKNSYFNNTTTTNFDTVVLNNVSFSYENNKTLIFDKFNYTFKKNKIIGIKGRSGKGKTTLLLLLLGLIKPTSGNILLNNSKNINNFCDWINKFGYVSQEAVLIDDTIKNNILFGQSKKYFNQKKYLSSIDFSLLSKIIEDKGEDAIIDNNNKLSSGQGQRVHLARAIYHSKDILILDEATNNLDKENETLFLEKLSFIKKNKIIVFVTHSDYVLSFCDEIINLDNIK